MAEPRQSRSPQVKRHKHEFTALSWNFGPYGDQDVHVHSCFTEGCYRALIGEGRFCGGPDTPHRRTTLDARFGPTASEVQVDA